MKDDETIAEPAIEPAAAQPPAEWTGLQHGQPGEYAAGIPGVVRAVQHIAAEAGLARGVRVLRLLNQKGGIDCMSCAWPEADGRRRIAEFCENGAKAVAWEADTRRLTPEFFRSHSVLDLSRRSDHWLGQQGRLTGPLVLREGASHYEPISWDDAFALLARELNALDSPDEAIFYTSGRASNEAAFLYQLFARQFGTNNLPDCSNMCHESSGTALSETIGIGKGTVTLEDFTRAQVILILGQNPATNHPRMLTTLQEAKAAGAKIIAVNPLIEPGLRRFKDPQSVSGLVGHGIALADLYLQVRINGDAALLKGILKDLLERDAAVCREFVQEKTHGWDAFAADLQQERYERLTAISGISREQMRSAADLLAGADRIIACWAMGLTQHRNAVATIQQVVNLLLLRGSIGKPGAGVCPVRGHSNVQGDRTMGIWERPRPEFLDALERHFGFQAPRRHGLDTVAAIQAMHAGRAHVFFALGGNFLSAAPDTEYTAEALRRTRLTAHVSTKLNRSHLVTGRQALILPCLGRTEIDRQPSGEEQFVTTENSMGVVEMSRGILEPAAETLLSEPAIVCRLARAVLGDRTSSVDWEGMASSYDRIRDAIAACVPGCADYNAKVRRPGGFYLPNGPREGRFARTATGRANFTVHPVTETVLQPGELLMMTIRSHDQFNTTIYGLDDVYRGIRSERRVILMSPTDFATRGLAEGDTVDLIGHWNGEERIARRFRIVPYDIPAGNCATYFPEANVLVPIDSVAEKSNTPTSKSVVITVRKTAPDRC